jgi:cyclopropane-fatty-acyl-phospholipid synthase
VWKRVFYRSPFAPPLSLGRPFRSFSLSLSAPGPIPQSHVSAEARASRLQAFIDELLTLPVAIQTADANEQHYEVPTAYFLAALGKHLKYSCCLFPPLPPGAPPISAAQARRDAADEPFAAAEEAMLRLACERAGLVDGQDVLELGCGWGSLCLFIAAAYPASRVTAVSNSRTQRAFIEEQAAARGFKNLAVLTRDAADWVPPPALFDRILSVECLEHMKNYGVLLTRLGAALRPGGALFIHVFVHDTMPYHFEPAGPTDWMARHFFAGGTMPAFHLLPRFGGGETGLTLTRQWAVSGVQYSRTLEAWLVRHDAARERVMAAMADAYGPGAPARRWNQRWRLFYLACSELFAYKGGDTWYVGHYRFDKGRASSRGGGAAGAVAADQAEREKARAGAGA